MRLLFLSNFYPPHHLGGYELLCREVATLLGERGHHVKVLTSTYGATREGDEPGIQRQLRLQSDIYYYRPQQVLRYFIDRQANLRVVRETLREVQPDIVVVWGMWNLSWSVAAEIERIMGEKVAYYLAGPWPADPTPHEAYWTARGRSWRGRALLHLLRPLVMFALRSEWRPCRLQLRNSAVCSISVEEEMRRAGVGPDRYRLIYHGVDAEVYRAAGLKRLRGKASSNLRVVYVGSLLPQKGVHTAIEALSILSGRAEDSQVTLDVLGAGHPQYEHRLHRMVKEYGLDTQVTFHRPIPRAQLPDFLAGFDVLVLPSVWEEPQALISQEAMASGLVLVATLTGGTNELLIDGVNGLAFQREDSAGLAKQLARLIDDEALKDRLIRAAWETINERFTTQRMLDAIETWLVEIRG